MNTGNRNHRARLLMAIMAAAANPHHFAYGVPTRVHETSPELDAAECKMSSAQKQVSEETLRKAEEKRRRKALKRGISNQGSPVHETVSPSHP